MDDRISPDERISPDKLNELRGRFPPPLVIDVRSPPAFEAASEAIPGAIRRTPEQVGEWADEIEIGRRIVVYCAHGDAVSQRAAGALRSRGRAAVYLDGGIESWRAHSLTLAAKPAAPTLWVTRERPKIDRIACPWLIRRFIDPDARFLYTPPSEVLEIAASSGAIPYDIPGVEFSHEGARRRSRCARRHRTRRRHLAARSDRPVGRPLCHLARSFISLRRRSAHATPRHRHLRRALCLVSISAGRDA